MIIPYLPKPVGRYGMVLNLKYCPWVYAFKIISYPILGKVLNLRKVEYIKTH